MHVARPSDDTLSTGVSGTTDAASMVDDPAHKAEELQWKPMPAASPRAWPPLTYVWSAVLGSAAVLALLRLAYDVRAVLVVVLFGVLFALVLVYPVNALARLLPRGLAALITGVLFIAAVVGAAIVLAPFFSDQLGWLVERVPAALNQARRVVEGLAPEQVRLPAGFEETIGREVARLGSRMIPVALDTVSGVFGTIAIIALAVFLAHDGRGAQLALLRVVPSSHASAVLEFLARAGKMLQRWMLGQLTAMTATGLLTGAGLLLLGVDSWLVLGLISFVFEFVPYVGPMLAAIPGIITGLAISPHMGLWVAAVYLGVQTVESYLMQPLIMKNAIRIHPAIQLVWQLVLASAFGLLGVFVATPLLAFIFVAVEFFYVERHLGKPPNPAH